MNRTNTILPYCGCCIPKQALVVRGLRAYCPLTEKIYENMGDGNFTPLVTITTATQPDATTTAQPTWGVADFYPGQQRRKGEAAPVLINPAEDRFGAC